VSGDQHTAAPWHAEISRGHAVIRGPDGHTIAVMSLHTEHRGGPEQAANARILGAGVELLHAAETLMLPLQAALDDGCQVNPVDLVATLSRVRHVIAKARGRRQIPDHPFDGRGGGRPG
jgi:hypothetical protein